MTDGGDSDLLMVKVTKYFLDLSRLSVGKLTDCFWPPCCNSSFNGNSFKSNSCREKCNSCVILLGLSTDCDLRPSILGKLTSFRFPEKKNNGSKLFFERNTDVKLTARNSGVSVSCVMTSVSRMGASRSVVATHSLQNPSGLVFGRVSGVSVPQRRCALDPMSFQRSA